MYTHNRDAYRQAFFIAWHKHVKKLPLNSVETQLLEAILLHPEFHPMLERPQQFQTQEFSLEENPFFHLSMHVSIREQIRLNRPQGITSYYEQLVAKYADTHLVDHLLIACLTDLMWQSQQTGENMEEKTYLEKVSTL